MRALPSFSPAFQRVPQIPIDDNSTSHTAFKQHSLVEFYSTNTRVVEYYSYCCLVNMMTLANFFQM